MTAGGGRSGAGAGTGPAGEPLLPEQVRVRVVALAAEVLGGLPADAVPAALRGIARFAPAKRARLGATALAAALEDDMGFRARVVEGLEARDAALVASVRSGEVPPAADPVEVAVAAYVVRAPGWRDLAGAAAEAERSAAHSAGRDRVSAAASQLREQLEAARAAGREDRERLRREIDRLKAENSGLRQRLQAARERAAQAEETAREQQDAALAAAEAAEAARSGAEAEARRARGRLADAEQALEAVRRSGREERDLGTARLRLLLDTLADAAAGLRRELALPAGDLRPADAVEAATPGDVQAGPEHGRARTVEDPRLLADLLALPQVHLVVDGYNVTKLDWAAMPLEDQRRRLVQGLAAVAARTGAEVTCVFDGSDVAVPPAVAGRGVRVRFSPPGETADELIRRLVRAEPPGRPVVVVSSDREVADGVRRPGARPVAARALLALLRH